LAIVVSGHVYDVTFAHPVVEASVLVGDTGDDDAAASSPHVFPTSPAHRSSSRSLALLGHVTQCSTYPLLPLDSFGCAVSLWD